ncbi:serine hydrolase [Tychonema sp. LEGE 07203]|uniref:serine hydrolase n=1 Tax=Tychonema sp. LEGE 07203 TaxID=1828671 RepID=UPI00187F4DEF|nr:serine hydrolase [Tychonema sp. LEGE 07203]MBE9093329.1 serine hydrolase [Tychonema sp. LEGE 07203]
MNNHKYSKQFTVLLRLQFASIVAVTATMITVSGMAAIKLSDSLASPSLNNAENLDREQLEFAYNTTSNPEFQSSQKLQNIVDEVVDIAAKTNLPTEPLSVTLIDLKTLNSAGYKNHIPRFPASVSKLFWMTALYAYIEKGMISEKAAFYTPLCKTDICKLIQKSDNEAASRILDQLTGTTSGLRLDGEEYLTWISKREQINRFFQHAGYKGININQKNFPIPYLKLENPQGRDLQLRGQLSQPIRNKMTTDHAARLMYEIFTYQAVSHKSSEEMISLLTRDLRPEVWKQDQYNSVRGFLGESLPINDVYFASKVGWTFSSRQEVAYTGTKDGKTAYILVIFADDPTYGDDWKIFPEMSLRVFQRMTADN